MKIIKLYLITVGLIFCSQQTHAQSIQTFPGGFHGLEKTKEILPQYSQALSEAGDLVGRVFGDKDLGTAYLFYSENDKRWEAHSAYHVVDDHYENSLPLAFDVAGTIITLQPNQVVSTEREHKEKDQVRYAVTYNEKQPDKILFKNDKKATTGSGLIILGYPGAEGKIKTSLGHALFSNSVGYLTTSLTAHSGTSGAPVFALGDHGNVYLVGTVVRAENIEAFASISYRTNKGVLPSVLSIMDINTILIDLSDQEVDQDRLYEGIRMYLSEAMFPYLRKIINFSKTPSLQYNRDHALKINEQRVRLNNAKQQIEASSYSQLHNTVLNLQMQWIHHYNENQDIGQSNLVNYTDYPMSSETQWLNTTPKDLKTILLGEIDKSIDALDLYMNRLDRVKNLFEQENLQGTIEAIQHLNLTVDEEAYNEYILPTLATVSLHDRD